MNILDHFGAFQKTVDKLPSPEDRLCDPNSVNLPSISPAPPAEESDNATAAKVRFRLQVEEVSDDDSAADEETLIDDDATVQTTSTPIQRVCDQSNTTETMAMALKSKLAELEREISQFRQHNAELTRLKQQHELERIQLAEDRTEQANKLQDERCRHEVELHDERIRIAEDRAELQRKEKLLRGPNRKEREDVTALRQQLDAAQKELAAKDQRHVAAQARLRAQLRVMEKDLKDCSYEVEQLKKENRKVEAENIRLRRQNNNKMLMEINRNIAKLSTGVESAAAAPVVAIENTSRKNIKIVPTKRKEAKQPAPVQDDGSGDSSSEDDNDVMVSADVVRPPVVAAVAATRQIITNESKMAASVKREIFNEDGSKDVWYPNGNIKKISADTMIIRMLYYNKDIKETNIQEGTVKYYYAETNTWHTSYLDGLEILEFPK